jgi:hypothetical protein
MPSHADMVQAIELAVRLATKACEDVKVLAREGLRFKPPVVAFADPPITFDGKQTITLRFKMGEEVEEYSVKTALPYDAGVYREGEIYPKGALTTFGGRSWIAQRDTSEKPDMTNKDWRLWSNKGRDGRDFDPSRHLGPPQPVRLGS